MFGLLFFITPLSTAAAKPNYKDLIQAQTKAVPARGENAAVVLVEASSANAEGKSLESYTPQLDHKQFAKIKWHVDTSKGVSKHSQTVATLLFGQWRSIAKGIKEVHVYTTRRWLARVGQWDLDPTHVSQIFPASIVNHSWVTTLGKNRDAALLRRVDYSALSNNILHVAGVRRQGKGEALLSGAYNVLSVGGAWANIDKAYPAIDDVYGNQRHRPHLVGPFPYSSAATPVVAAAAVRLNALATSLSLSPAKTRAQSEALPVEVLRAILMSSASGAFDFSHQDERRRNQYGAFGLSPNGLDVRFGMGLLNVAAAETVLRSGVNTEDLHASRSGWRFVSPVDESGEQKPLRVPLIGEGKELAASVNWLADVAPTEPDARTLKARLANFDLCLFDVTDERQLVHESAATQSSSENLRIKLAKDRRYELVVQPRDETPWTYALAWHTATSF